MPRKYLLHALHTEYQVQNGFLANIKRRKLVPSMGIAKLKCREQKAVYSISIAQVLIKIITNVNPFCKEEFTEQVSFGFD